MTCSSVSPSGPCLVLRGNAFSSWQMHCIGCKPVKVGSYRTETADAPRDPVWPQSTAVDITHSTCTLPEAEGQTLSVVLKVMLDRPMSVIRARMQALV